MAAPAEGLVVAPLGGGWLKGWLRQAALVRTPWVLLRAASHLTPNHLLVHRGACPTEPA